MIRQTIMTCVLFLILAGVLLADTSISTDPSYPRELYRFVYSQGKIVSNDGDVVIATTAKMWVEDAETGTSYWWQSNSDGKGWNATTSQLPSGDYFVYPSVGYKTKEGKFKTAVGRRVWVQVP